MCAMPVRRRDRRQLSLSPPRRPTPIGITTMAVNVSPNIRLTLDQSVVLGDFSNITVVNAGNTRTVLSASLFAANVVDLVMSGTVAATNVATIPDLDPLVRNKFGGYLPPRTWVLT